MLTSPFSGLEKMAMLRATAPRMKTITKTANIIPFLWLSSSGLFNSCKQNMKRADGDCRHSYHCLSWSKSWSWLVKLCIAKLTLYPKEMRLDLKTFEVVLYLWTIVTVGLSSSLLLGAPASIASDQHSRLSSQIPIAASKYLPK